jgi:hypothetical protein
MTENEKLANTRAKIKKVQDLQKELFLVVEAKQRVMPNGYIETVINFIDTEQYPDEPVAPAPEPEHIPRNDSLQKDA